MLEISSPNIKEERQTAARAALFFADVFVGTGGPPCFVLPLLRGDDRRHGAFALIITQSHGTVFL